MQLGPIWLNSAPLRFGVCLLLHLIIFALPKLNNMSTSSIPSTPKRRHTKTDRREYDTLKKARFFDAFDRRKLEGKTAKQIYREKDVPKRTAENWLRIRKELGSKAERHTRKLSDKLGRKGKLSPELCKWLCTIENKYRDWPLEAQIEKHDLKVHFRTLQRSLRKHISNARMHKKPRVKRIFKKNKGLRVEYGAEHEEHIMDDFWKYVVFSDEGHIDSGCTPGQRVLCEEGTRLRPENLQEMPGRNGVTVHYSGSCNWFEGLGSLKKYKCVADSPDVEVKKEPKPRRRPKKDSTGEEYEQRLRDWEARQPHELEIAGQGNSMTQQYYRDNLLPGLCDQVEELKRKRGRGILQEDNDSSHGTRPNKATKIDNVCEAYRKERGVETIKHSAQSLDLNAFESINNIIKARIRREPKSLGTQKELEDILDRVYYSISRDQVRARIEEMHWRCKEVQRRDGKAIKSYLW